MKHKILSIVIIIIIIIVVSCKATPPIYEFFGIIYFPDGSTVNNTKFTYYENSEKKTISTNDTGEYRFEVDYDCNPWLHIFVEDFFPQIIHLKGRKKTTWCDTTEEDEAEDVHHERNIQLQCYGDATHETCL